MKWSEVRERFPNQFVLVEELASHVEGDRVLVDDVAVVRAVPEEEAAKTLMQCRDKMFVYHTYNDSVVIELRRRPGLRGDSVRMEYSQGLLLASLTVTYNGRTKTIDRMSIDTGAAHTIKASD